MAKAISIYEAKAHLSKYSRQAKAGSPVYIGSYGSKEVMLVPVPNKKPIKIGIWKDRKIGYRDEGIIGPDPSIIKDFEDSLNRPVL